VGSDGLIKTATTNLLSYSEDFSNAAWDALTSATKVSATGVDDPAGGTTASTWRNDGTSNADGGIRRTISGTSGLTYTYSAWIRRRTGTGNISMVVGQNVDFDVTSQVTSEWNRISVTNTADTNTRGYIFIGTPGDEIDIWGAQLEQSSTVGEYVKTTSTINSAPRFDHDPTTGESLGLLVEELRTNYFQWSNSDADGETWNNVGGGLDLASGQADPAGGSTAIRATDADNSISGTFLQRTNLASLTTGATVSYSIWLKPISCPNNLLSLFVYANGTTDYINAVFTVSGEQITGTGVINAGGTGVVIDSSVTPYPNGWYRCVLTGIPSTVTMTDVRARVNLGSYQRVQGTARFDWYGAQLEVGSFPTSYIPTSGSEGDRSADVASITGTNFSSWYNQDEGTVFADCTVIGDNGANQFIYSISDGALGNEIRAFKTSANDSLTTAIEDSVNGITSSQFGNTNSPFGVPFTFAHGFANNSAARAINGIVTTPDTTVTVPSVNQVRIGARMNETFPSCIYLSRLTYWPTRLPDSALQTITQ
jgi:hypothetical protein